ncbi:MAG: hypothetical protein IT529_08820 [Burkholderiales bacterium]|nr:hypothetical protein [Burkholderiales bacterium]
MKEDFWLLITVVVVWAALALLYAFVPLFHMPGYAGVWGWGALIFLVLAVLLARSRGRRGRRDGAATDTRES